MARPQFELVAEAVPVEVALQTQQITFADGNPVALNGGAAGVAVQVDVQAGANNANPVFVGSAAAQFAQLAAGQSWSAVWGRLDVSSIRVRGTAGDTVAVVWLQRV